MKKIFLIFFILLTGLISAQSSHHLLIEGSQEEAVMNAVYSPDGNKIAYTKSNYQGIWIYNLQSNSSKLITDETAAGFGFKWSSDSKSILSRVAKYEDLKRYNAVKVYNIETDEVTQLSEYQTMMPYLPMWADGDSKIYLPLKSTDEVFSTGKDKNNNHINNIVAFEKNNKIVVKSLSDNSEQTFEPIKDAQYINVSVSPNKSKIVFEVMSGNMFVVNIDGTNLIDLGIGYRPRWSFDSNKIIYMVTEDDGHDYTASDIFIIHSDGTEKKNLTKTSDIMEMNPCPSPDGKSIVFDVYDDGSIYLMNIE